MLKNVFVDHVVDRVHHLFFYLLYLLLFDLTQNLLPVYVSFVLFLHFQILFGVYNILKLIILFLILFLLKLLQLRLICFFVIYLLQNEVFVVKGLCLSYSQFLIHRSSILSRILQISLINLLIIITGVFIPGSVSVLLNLMVNSLIRKVSILMSLMLLWIKNRLKEIVVLWLHFLNFSTAVRSRLHASVANSAAAVSCRSINSWRQSEVPLQLFFIYG